ncbi:hypothetical protein D3C77_485960 [compost metagenome]
MDPPVWREIRVDGHATPFEGDLTNEIEEEGLAGAVLSDDEPDGRAPIGDAIHVAHEGADLSGPADLDMRQARPGHDACGQRLKDDVAVTRLEHRCGGHAAKSRARS